MVEESEQRESRRGGGQPDTGPQVCVCPCHSKDILSESGSHCWGPPRLNLDISNTSSLKFF